jgi:2'-5' RNA ligase
VAERLFLGVFPDETTRARIKKVADGIAPYLRGQGRGVRPNRYHLTVHHLGDYPRLPPERVDAALAAMARIDTPAFDLRLDHADGFEASQKPPCVLRCSIEPPALRNCWQQAWSQFREAGFGQWLHPAFTPHLTLFYADNALAEPIAVEPITIAVREIVLAHSLPGNSDYRVLGRQPLAPFTR